jgi:FkbM family methyltransferase
MSIFLSAFLQAGDLVFDVGANVGNKTTFYLACGARVINLEMITLDEAIATYGLPKFCKIDVEGFELPVLQGLSSRIPCISFEIAIEFLDEVERCLERLTNLGYNRFSFAHGESSELAIPWVDVKDLSTCLRESNDPKLWGDVYAIAPEVSPPLLLVGGERWALENFLPETGVMFDVGAHVGAWTQSVLARNPNLNVHLFEPTPNTYQKLLRLLTCTQADRLAMGQLICNPLAVSNTETTLRFHAYKDSGLNSLYRRNRDLEINLGLGSPSAINLPTTTLDAYCDRLGIHHVHFVKIDVEGAELDVLQGAKNLLQHELIDFIQFEYGGTYQDAGISFGEVHDFLDSYNYFIFVLNDDGMEWIPYYDISLEDYNYKNFLAISKRIVPFLMGETPQMLDIHSLLSEYKITARGAIHIGAHEGQEIGMYQNMGVQSLLLIEANPSLIGRLCDRVAETISHDPAMEIQVENCAISNENGTAIFRVTSSDQSSSLLPLNEHQKIYPDITETECIEVPLKTLDTLLDELKCDRTQFNLLNLDIQGAELLALKGATQTLAHIDAINTEINFVELYKGGALIWELDALLEDQGFVRVATTTPYHPSWGDALYIRKPTITMSGLGQVGRFGNQIFQYAFLRIYAREHHLRIETSAWIGQSLFGFDDPAISRTLPTFQENFRTNTLEEARVINAGYVLENINLLGHFQYPTAYFAKHRDFFRTLFQPVPPLQDLIDRLEECLRFHGKTVLGIHIRVGDYRFCPSQFAPPHWYLEWLRGYWQTLESPILFLASDDLALVQHLFADYNPIVLSDLLTLANIDPQDMEIVDLGFYLDFSLLSRCDLLAISNSSFSFAAAMLNDRSQIFMRPHIPTQKLISFDPWNDVVCPIETVDAAMGDYSPSASVYHFYDNLALSPEEIRLWLPDLQQQYERLKASGDRIRLEDCLATLRQVRRYLAEFLVRWEDQTDVATFWDEIGALIYQTLISLDLSQEPYTPSEAAFLEWLESDLKAASQPWAKSVRSLYGFAQIS